MAHSLRPTAAAQEEGMWAFATLSADSYLASTVAAEPGLVELLTPTLTITITITLTPAPTPALTLTLTLTLTRWSY